jgi:ribosomal protein L11 methyltransferase
MDYLEFVIQLKDASQTDILEAELAELAFESFLVEGASLKAYIPSTQADTHAIDDVLKTYSDLILGADSNLIPHTNWNAVWESSYEPVLIDDAIYVRAPFHPTRVDVESTILLDPNMSFGTGHHPTTHMILSEMRSMNLQGKRVMDFGCGSGILAIYASQRGAHGIGIEIDAHAAEAARTNLKLNDVSTFSIVTGDLQAFAEAHYDLILANINRNVIEESVHTFNKNLSSGGTLLCAGFLNADAPGLRIALEQAGLTATNTMELNGWTMLAAQKIV